jgi:hypothetical protein
MMRPPRPPRYSPPRQIKPIQGPGTVPPPRAPGKSSHKPAKGSSPRPPK